MLFRSWSTYLDPTKNPPEERPWGSKVLINACKEHRYLPVFSKRTRLRKSIYRTVADRWNELGLPGTVPNVLSFEPEPGENRGGSRYHDEKALRSAGDMMPAAKPTKRPAEKRARPRKK